MDTPDGAWPSYLSRFHAERPGITEDVLGRCRSAGLTPYEWLVAGLDADLPFLDLACGSGPARPEGATHWMGLDLSAAELARARASGRTAVVRGDATRLPVADGGAAVVTCSMGLMLVEPLAAALAEVRRALRPDGEVRLLLPARAPLTTGDRLRYARLFWAARATTAFPPTPLRRHAATTLAQAGLRVTDDTSRRFTLALDQGEDAARFVDSWYLPAMSPARRDAARTRAARVAPTVLGVPFRRIVARRADRAAG